MRRSVIAVMAGLTLVACASDGATVSARDSSSAPPTSLIAPNPACPKQPAAPPDSCGIADGTAENPNPAVGAHLIVSGTVIAVTAPRWNQPDGTDWTTDYVAHEDGSIRQAPYRYRLATVKINEMFLGTSAARDLLHPDGTATVAFYGDGTDTGMEYGVKPGTAPSSACASALPDCSYQDNALRFNNLNGPVAVGDQVIYMLNISTIRMRDQADDFSVLMTAGWRGNFHIEADGRYHNLDPTVSYSRQDIDALIDEAKALCPAAPSHGSSEPSGETQTASANAVDDNAAPLASSSPGQCP